MRVPKYYCPHCERFKKWYQVEAASTLYGMQFYCKHCGEQCEDVAYVLRKYCDGLIRKREKDDHERK